MARAKRNWIQEERRRTLGDWVAFCPACGHVARYFEEHETDRPIVCPQCGPVRIGMDLGDGGAKTRICRKCGQPLEKKKRTT